MTAKLYGDVKPGDRLFRAQRGHRQNDPLRTDWIVVSKVGRKWAEFHPEGQKHPGKWSLGRFNIEDGRLDAEFGYGGLIHRNEEAFTAHTAAVETWGKLYRKLQWKALPPGVTEADILTAAELLKVDLSDD